jgi:hypothetical protein
VALAGFPAGTAVLAEHIVGNYAAFLTQVPGTEPSCAEYVTLLVRDGTGWEFVAGRDGGLWVALDGDTGLGVLVHVATVKASSRYRVECGATRVDTHAQKRRLIAVLVGVRHDERPTVVATEG